MEYELFVKDGKVWNKPSNTFPKTSRSFKEHKGHRLQQVPFRHFLYTGRVCLTCNDGVILLDEDM